MGLVFLARVDSQAQATGVSGRFNLRGYRRPDYLVIYTDQSLTSQTAHTWVWVAPIDTKHVCNLGFRVAYEYFVMSGLLGNERCDGADR